MAWEYLKFFHLCFAFIMMGGIFLSQYAIVYARKTTEPGIFATYLKMSAVGGKMSMIGLVSVSLLGVLTAWQQDLDLTATGWLNAAYGTAILALIIPFFTFARWEKQAAQLMPDALTQGQVLPEQHRLVGGPQYRGINIVMTILIVWMLVLMVFKPF
ncbi:MAG: DUF2269 family protein [Chloroflexi bacterium]|nr:DUF2269 family protein [Chloroflexota bacterium]